MELKYTFKTLKLLQKQEGKEFEELITKPTPVNLSLLVQYGLGCSETQADEAIEKFLEEGNDLKEVWAVIYEALQKGRFLDQSVNIREKIDEAMKASS
jgi:hypothetical protein